MGEEALSVPPAGRGAADSRGKGIPQGKTGGGGSINCQGEIFEAYKYYVEECGRRSRRKECEKPQQEARNTQVNV